jgi:hypothetical protein
MMAGCDRSEKEKEKAVREVIGTAQGGPAAKRGQGSEKSMWHSQKLQGVQST